MARPPDAMHSPWMHLVCVGGVDVVGVDAVALLEVERDKDE